MPQPDAITTAGLTERIRLATRRPEPFEPSEAPFWDDDHISARLLLAHLDDSGVDLSRSSIGYARARAEDAGLDIDYRVQDFLTLDEPEPYDLVLQAYGELSTFSAGVRDDLLRRMTACLAPGGAIVFDVSTPSAHPRPAAPRRWSVDVDGLWRPGVHLVLDERIEYPDHLCCNQYVVVDDAVVTYRMWFQDYTPATLTHVLAASGLAIEHLWGSLTGTPLMDDSPFIAVVAHPAALET